jgi:hypothetical protein
MMWLQGRIMDTHRNLLARGLTRRHVVRAGAAGAAAVWLGGFERLAGLAGATTLKAPLRRSSYAGLSGTFAVAVGAGTQTLEFAGVEDLPIAASRPELRGHDDAFSLQLRGDATTAFPQGTRQFSHPDLGEFSLFLAPVEQATETQTYEAIIDRTVKIPGLNDDGTPVPVGQVTLRNRRRRKRRHHRHRH